MNQLLSLVSTAHKWKLSGTLCAIVLIVVAACDYKADSPISGRRVTQTELRAEAEAAEKEAQIQIRSLGAEADIAMRELQHRYEEELMRLELEYDLEAEKTMAAGELLKGKVEAANESIEKKMGAARAIYELLAKLPNLDPTVGAALGLGGLLIGVGSRKDKKSNNGSGT